MTEELKRLLALLAQKHGGFTALLIFDDGSGRITENSAEPYEIPPLFDFGNVDDLVKYLES